LVIVGCGNNLLTKKIIGNLIYSWVHNEVNKNILYLRKIAGEG
jgi:hypothetical protein